MTLLALDTSTAACSVCVERADGERFETEPDPARLLAAPAHAVELMPAIDRQLGAAGVAFGELSAIAVGVGPGAYTGLRIGIATARAIAQAHGLMVRPVGSLAALAEGIGAPVSLPIVDARRRELFAALYVDGDARWGPDALRPEALVRRLAASRG